MADVGWAQLGLTPGCVLSPRSAPYVSAYLDQRLFRARSCHGDRPEYKGTVLILEAHVSPLLSSCLLASTGQSKSHG